MALQWENSCKTKNQKIRNLEIDITKLDGELNERIDKFEITRKELKFVELQNQELNKKMEKFEFIIRERDSYLLMYKNSQIKVNKLDSEREEYKEEFKKVKQQFTRAVNTIFETNNDSLISQLDVILGNKS